MKICKCEWGKDVYGFYVTPLLGFSNVYGEKSFWIGWLRCLFRVYIGDRVK